MEEREWGQEELGSNFWRCATDMAWETTRDRQTLKKQPDRLTRPSCRRHMAGERALRVK